MRIGILGSGVVAQTLGTRLVQVGHQVKLGSRTATNDKAAAWAKSRGDRAAHGTFADAAKFGEVLFNCTAGAVSLDALQAAGAANLRGKILIDVATPLDFSKGMPPTLTVCNTDSLGERIQRAFPDAKVVKTLNTVNCEVMVNPGLVPGDHDLFVSGDDPAARKTVAGYLREWFGWKSVIRPGRPHRRPRDGGAVARLDPPDDDVGHPQVQLAGAAVGRQNGRTAGPEDGRAAGAARHRYFFSPNLRAASRRSS